MAESPPRTDSVGRLSALVLQYQDILVGLALFCIAVLVYIRHLAPTIVTGDSADATLAAYTLGIPHPPGFPVYVAIGHLFTFVPVGDVAYRLNLMSAIFGALVIPVVYLIIRSFAPGPGEGFRNLASHAGAVLGALSLAFSLYFWYNAEIAEVNTLNTFFLALVVLLTFAWARKRDARLLYLIALLFALSAGISAANILYIPAFVLFLYLTDRTALTEKKTLFGMAGIFIAAGLFQLLFLYIRALQGPAYVYTGIRDPGVFINFVTAREYAGVPFSLPLAQGLGMFSTYLIDNVALPGIVIGIAGVALSLRQNRLWSGFLSSVFAINLLFFATYNSFDIYDKFLPAYMIFSVFIGLCVREALWMIGSPSRPRPARKAGKRGTTKEPERPYFRFALIVLVLLAATYIPVNAYGAHTADADQSDRTALASFLAYSLTSVPAGSAIIDVWQTVEPLRYFQIVYQVNPHTEVLGAQYGEWPDRIRERIGKRGVFIFRADRIAGTGYSAIPVLSMPGVGTLFQVSPGTPSFIVTDPEVQYPADRVWDGQVALTGYNLSQDAGHRTFSLRSFWQKSGNAAGDPVLVLGLTDSKGTVVLEDRHTLFSGAFPPARWPSNATLKEDYTVLFPPSLAPGNYRLSLGVGGNSSPDAIAIGNAEVGKVHYPPARTGYDSIK